MRLTVCRSDDDDDDDNHQSKDDKSKPQLKSNAKYGNHKWQKLVNLLLWFCKLFLY